MREPRLKQLMKFEQFIEKNSVLIQKKYGEHIFRQGDNNDSLYILRKGLLKAYYITYDGKEFIKTFVIPENMIGSLSSVVAKKKCSFNLICLEPSTLFKLSYDNLNRMAHDDIEIAHNIISFLIDLSMKKEIRESDFLCLSAEERYVKLIQQSPPWLERVTQNDIARYLGITPVGLSRIKKRLG
jgi:CRP-like cAMP-binding protein